MSPDRNKPLLSDVLAEDSNADFRQALLDHTLRIVRRNRRFRKVRQGAYASLTVVALALISIHFFISKPPASKRLEPSYALVMTQPLPASALLSTSPDHSVAAISTAPTVEWIATAESSPILHQLDDDELLALLPSPALLVRRGPHIAELVFANTDAQHALSPN
jgi:hypothetical protein